MVNIPNDITNPEDAKHWLLVNGHSVESAESIMANWSASDSSAPIAEEEVEEVLENDDYEEDDWEDDDESEDEE